MYDVGNHNHEPSDDIISRQALVNHMKQKIRDDPFVSLRRVYDQSVVEARRAIIVDDENVPMFHRIASQLKRSKRKFFPDIPEEVEDVVINGEWRLT